MNDFLKVVNTTKKVQSNIEKFESLTLKDIRPRSNSSAKSKRPIIELNDENEPPPLLTAVSTQSVGKNSNDSKNSLAPPTTISPQSTGHRRHDSAVFVQKHYLRQPPATSLPDDARAILKSQPSLEDVDAVLAYIQCGIDGQHEFNIKVTGPKASQLVLALATTTLPDLWPNLGLSRLSKSDTQMKNTLLASLFSVTGIQAILEQFKSSSRQSRVSRTKILHVYTDFLATLLSGSNTVMRFLTDMKMLYEKDVQRRLFWQAIISLLAGGKVLSLVASLGSDLSPGAAWLGNGRDFSRWLARNVVKASIDTKPDDQIAWSNLCQLLKKALSLGHRDVLITEVYTSLLLGSQALWTPLHMLVNGLPKHDQKHLFDSILNDLLRKYFATSPDMSISATDVTTAKAITGAAALINGLTSNNEYLLECAASWVGSSGPAQASRGSGMKRALIAVLARSHGRLERILEDGLTVFSDKLHLQNAPTAQQEHLAQTILLTIGYLHRRNPSSLKQDPLPSLVMNSVSNRLASSGPRTRLFGMIVGVAVSRCVDEPGKVMDFQVEEMETEEVKEFLALTTVEDRIGDLEDLKSLRERPTPLVRTTKKGKIVLPKQVDGERPQMTSKIMAIEELSSSSDDEDDLVPYQKPTDDPEDSDEDPTLINRDKPRAPIYIIDLIKQLQSPSDKLDIISLAIKTAPGLIRRKANFGTELSDNIHSLASALVNLQDGMSEPEHQQQRLDALVACIVAQPERMSEYLTKIYFDGDFSILQRSTLLIALGLGARELAGFADTNNTAQFENLDTFPSQRLPAHLQPKPLTGSQEAQQKQLKSTTNPVALLTNSATLSTIRPLVESALESQSGPSVFKINRTSSRLSATLSQQRQKPTAKQPNIKNVNAIITTHIYLPLISSLSALLAYTRTLHTPLLHPSTLILHLQTLTLLLHTLGPTGLSPPQAYSAITHETIILLNNLSRSSTGVVYDGIVLPAALGLMLALIDITVEIGITAQERLLGNEFGDAVAELVRWVVGLEGGGRAPPPVMESDSIGKGSGRGGLAWTVLAAGIQVRWTDIGRRFQGRMLGFSLDD